MPFQRVARWIKSARLIAKKIMANMRNFKMKSLVKSQGEVPRWRSPGEPRRSQSAAQARVASSLAHGGAQRLSYTAAAAQRRFWLKTAHRLTPISAQHCRSTAPRQGRAHAFQIISDSGPCEEGSRKSCRGKKLGEPSAFYGATGWERRLPGHGRTRDGSNHAAW